MNRQIDTNGEDFSIWQVDHDVNGNARYVVSYLAVPANLSEDEAELPYPARQSIEFETARGALHGKRYRAKWFGGGIVFQAYAGDPLGHVKAAIRLVQTGETFYDAYRAVRAEHFANGA